MPPFVRLGWQDAILRRQGETNQAIALRLGITEGAVRYHLKRLAQKAEDGRAKLSLIAQLELVEAVDHWWKEQLEQLPKDRAPNVKELWTFLSDNLKTGVARGSGVWGEINEAYSAYARTMGFHVDPHQVRKPNQKGKVERRVGVVKSLDFRRVFATIDELQRYTDETMQREAVVRKCPVTGDSVNATWLKERELLRPLPATMPEPFDLIKQAQVYKDCTIRFEGKTFAVPFRYAHKTVEVRGCAHIIQVVDPKTGEIVHELPRNTRGLVLIDQACYEPTDAERLDDSIPKPLPLGAMAKRIEELASTGAPCRSIDFYESLAALKAASHK